MIRIEVKEQVLLELISKHMENKKMTGNSLHRFMKGKSCLPNPVAFYGKNAGLVDEEQAVDAAYLNFRKSFNILIHKFKYELHKWTVRQIKNWLN